MTIDRYGIDWDLPAAELCPECGQPDNCGDCNHEPLSWEQAESLGGFVALRIAEDRAGWGIMDERDGFVWTGGFYGNHPHLDDDRDHGVWFSTRAAAQKQLDVIEQRRRK